MAESSFTLIAAPFTPLQEDGTLAEAVIERQAARLAADGVDGAFVCGTTGEGPSLTSAERMRVAERWVANAGPLRVLVHVGHASIAESRALAAHAARIGAAGVGCFAPFFFRPATVDDLVASAAAVAAAAPELPFFYYHIPSMTGVDLPMRAFLPVAAARIPNLAGIKYTHDDLDDFEACTRFEGGRYEMLFGRDEMLLDAVGRGATAAIGSTYNSMAARYRRMFAAWRSGDTAAARAEQDAARAVIDVMLRHGGLPAGKAMMGLVGVDCGPVRLPLAGLDAEARQRLQVDLAAVGFPGS
jgi:N-acetylneuraminate lyase